MSEQDDEVSGRSESDEDEFFSREPDSELITMVLFQRFDIPCYLVFISDVLLCIYVDLPSS